MKKFIIKRLLLSTLILFLVSMILYGVMNPMAHRYINQRAQMLSQKPGARESKNEIKEKLKKQYPDKKIIISEIGTNDYWECLAAPSSWYAVGSSKTGGKAADAYVTAMLEFFIKNNVDIEELWWW